MVRKNMKFLNGNCRLSSKIELKNSFRKYIEC